MSTILFHRCDNCGKESEVEGDFTRFKGENGEYFHACRTTVCRLIAMKKAFPKACKEIFGV